MIKLMGFVILLPEERRKLKNYLYCSTIESANIMSDAERAAKSLDKGEDAAMLVSGRLNILTDRVREQKGLLKKALDILR